MVINSREDLVAIADENSYICGYGANGEIVLTFLKLNGIRIKGILDKEVKAINGERTVQYDSLVSKDISKAKFIISSTKYNNEIMKTLHKHGIDESQVISLAGIWVVEDIYYYNLEKTIGITKEIKTSFLKNLYRGRRAFIIGNGPSLSVADLDKLKSEITFATNQITGAFNHTEWRPTFYFIEDIVGAKDFYSKEHQFKYIATQCKYLFVNMRTCLYKLYQNNKFDNVYFYKLIQPDINPECNDTNLFSENLDDIVYGVGTTVYSMYQFAMCMGIKEIYLIGMDFNFQNEMSIDGKITVNSDVVTHAEFVDESAEHKPIYVVDKILWAHKTAREYAKTHGIKIYNATRGGKLEVFDRVDFDSLF